MIQPHAWAGHRPLLGWAGLGWGGDGTWEKATKTHYHPLSTVHSMLYAVYTGAKHYTTYNISQTERSQL